MKRIFLLMIGIIIASCSPRYTDLGWEKFYENDYVNADKIFRKILTGKPNDPLALKGMGITQLMLKNISGAEEFLLRSYKLKSDDPETALNLGLCYSSQKKNGQAIDYFNKCLELSPDLKMKNEVQILLQNEKRKMFASQIANAVLNEMRLTKNEIKKGSIAIIPFVNQGLKGDYDALQEGIADMFITYFGYISNLQVLERIHVNELLKEIKLSKSKPKDSKTAYRIGMLLKAEIIITGSYSIDKDETININFFTININTSKVGDFIEKKGPLTQFFSMHKNLTLSAIDQMKIYITEEQRKKILTYPTEDFFEFIASLKRKYAEESEPVSDGLDWLKSRLIFTSIQSPIYQITAISQTIAPKEIIINTNPIQTPSLDLPPGFFPK